MVTIENRSHHRLRDGSLVVKPPCLRRCAKKERLGRSMIRPYAGALCRVVFDPDATTGRSF